MRASISRAQFIRGNFRGDRQPIRPPWALTEEQFVDLCTRCSDCITACPDNLIVNGWGEFPEMDFAKGGCDFCGDCLTACKPKALLQSTPDTKPWSIVASIKKTCLSLHAVTCRSCAEVCDERAISFKLQLGGKAIPLLDQDLCNGCGECFAVCPIKAVDISPNEMRVETMRGGS